MVLDGRIARLIKGTSKVGKELDSLTDMISFGVAPAFIMYFWILNTFGRIWMVNMCLIYIICVALRLARFNVNSESRPFLEKIIFLKECHHLQEEF
jgi:CDP-diacylglycerol--serine O-phosphatidyltransferase